jgi:hypothetical protein
MAVYLCRCGIAESDTRLRITPGGSEVERMGYAVCALSTSGGKNSPDAAVPQSLVPVRQPIFVFAREKMTVPIEGVSTDFDLQTPAFEQTDARGYLLRIGRAGWRQQSHTISRLESPRFQRCHLGHSAGFTIV